MAYTFEPAIVTDGEGNETISHEQGELKQSSHFHRGVSPMGFEVDEMTGEATYFEEEEAVTANDSYMADIAEAYPQLPDALTYAHANMDAELMSHFYAASEDGALDQFHEILEIILDEYDEHLGTTSDELDEAARSDAPELTDVEETEEEEDYEVPDLSSLYEAEPDEELSDTFTDLAEQSEGVEQLLYQLSARFHSGGETADELIELALSSGYSRDELITAFNQLNN